ncbi:hypothetical protein C1Y40_05057 [Mycobacterium talmoniae]|uniref:Uncharacterized protein n=1 Tax=Mycobacterium talmoniae TaxID=1858794 RepID=A0A2S8BDM6_9MYCO|nr:hypothetical protein C1Y40_05057 [Mycobacterium talmoniae]
MAAAEAEAKDLTVERAEAETEELAHRAGAGGRPGRHRGGAGGGATGAIKELEAAAESRHTRRRGMRWTGR